MATMLDEAMGLISAEYPAQGKMATFEALKPFYALSIVKHCVLRTSGRSARGRGRRS
jgi:hypothetical protein